MRIVPTPARMARIASDGCRLAARQVSRVSREQGGNTHVRTPADCPASRQPAPRGPLARRGGGARLAGHGDRARPGRQRTAAGRCQRATARQRGAVADGVFGGARPDLQLAVDQQRQHR
ncbi:hypothetical protein CO2235_10044 [Cupriavidus oxalaticus]|uniref:Uncharacterized protein n=1 Tax=Cupriavidus oxalaticus TaxID=96344 RepID=A0A375FYP1_9BURK|nr:hypothetical protein CO2235_10044 [Cupriavidus oxalaticus]